MHSRHRAIFIDGWSGAQYFCFIGFVYSRTINFGRKKLIKRLFNSNVCLILHQKITGYSL
jgi:hypothetical protein